LRDIIWRHLAPPGTPAGGHLTRFTSISLTRFIFRSSESNTDFLKIQKMEERPVGPKWKGSKFEMRCGLFGLSCHVGVILVLNMISSMVVLGTQGVFIYKKSSTFALGGFTGPFLGKKIILF
jgi:hypothetical protein